VKAIEELSGVRVAIVSWDRGAIKPLSADGHGTQYTQPPVREDQNHFAGHSILHHRSDTLYTHNLVNELQHKEHEVARLYARSMEYLATAPTPALTTALCLVK